MHIYVCVSGGNKYLFFEKFGVLCFLETPVLRLDVLPCYQRILFAKNIRKDDNHRKEWIEIQDVINC